jgi:hypothetical protein
MKESPNNTPCPTTGTRHRRRVLNGSSGRRLHLVRCKASAGVMFVASRGSIAAATTFLRKIATGGARSREQSPGRWPMVSASSDCSSSQENKQEIIWPQKFALLTVPPAESAHRSQRRHWPMVIGLQLSIASRGPGRRAPQITSTRERRNWRARASSRWRRRCRSSRLLLPSAGPWFTNDEAISSLTTRRTIKCAVASPSKFRITDCRFVLTAQCGSETCDRRRGGSDQRPLLQKSPGARRFRSAASCLTGP